MGFAFIDVVFSRPRLMGSAIDIVLRAVELIFISRKVNETGSVDSAFLVFRRLILARLAPAIRDEEAPLVRIPTNGRCFATDA